MSNEATCIDESIYSDALTRGHRYTIIDSDYKNSKIRIRGNNNRIRWYPLGCFDLNNEPVTKLLLFSVEDIDDELDAPLDIAEVNIRLTTGELRWCWFVTPVGALQLDNTDRIHNLNVRFQYDNQHLIIMNKLTYETIEYALRHIDSQNKLIDCTLHYAWVEDFK